MGILLHLDKLIVTVPHVEGVGPLREIVKHITSIEMWHPHTVTPGDVQQVLNCNVV